MTDVKIIRLTTGEELITEATKSEGGWKIDKALLLVPVSVTNLSMIPWLAHAEFPEDGLFIPDSLVAFAVDPQKRLKAEYEKAFSKIITPDAGDVVAANMGELGNKLRLIDE